MPKRIRKTRSSRAGQRCRTRCRVFLEGFSLNGAVQCKQAAFLSSNEVAKLAVFPHRRLAFKEIGSLAIFHHLAELFQRHCSFSAALPGVARAISCSILTPSEASLLIVSTAYGTGIRMVAGLIRDGRRDALADPPMWHRC